MERLHAILFDVDGTLVETGGAGGESWRRAFRGYGSDSADRGELTRIAIHRAEGILGLEIDTCRVLVVGDTPKDVCAARAAGATPVAVATGHYSQADLHAADAYHVLATLEQPLPGAVAAVV